MRYFHVPRTGGRWITKVIWDCNIPILTVKNHGRIGIGQNQYTFISVRNPLSWYQSFWLDKVTRSNWNLNQPFQRFCKSDKFAKFVNLMIEQWSGYYTQVLRTYVLDFQKPQLDEIIHLENLRDELYGVLVNAGEDKRDDIKAKIDGMPNNFKSKREDYRIQYNETQVKAIYDQDQEVFDAFYPSFSVEDYLNGTSKT